MVQDKEEGIMSAQLDRREFLKQLTGAVAIATIPITISGFEESKWFTKAGIHEILDETKLPEGMSWFELGGQKVFNIHTREGSKVEAYCSYLISEGKKLGVCFDARNKITEQECRDAIDTGIKEFQSCLEAKQK